MSYIKSYLTLFSLCYYLLLRLCKTNLKKPIKLHKINLLRFCYRRLQYCSNLSASINQLTTSLLACLTNEVLIVALLFLERLVPQRLNGLLEHFVPTKCVIESDALSVVLRVI